MNTIRILIIQGPNLNLTGIREPEHYGTLPLTSIDQLLKPMQKDLPGVHWSHFQSNHEGELIDAIQNAADQGFHGMIINPGAFTHTSVAMGDALKASPIPAIEVHLSHVYQREEFRRHNLVAHACRGSISGLGLKGYLLAFEYLIDLLHNQH